MPNQFFAEGNDIKFLKDILNYKAKSKPDDIFIKTQGWTTIPLITAKFFENTNKGGKNFVFFDANGKPDERRAELLTKAKELGIEFELFLFPNNKDGGAVESLLLQIILQKYNPIFQCFENYSQCILNANEQYKLPDFKSKFYAFAEATGQKTSLMEIDFLDTGYYELNHNSLQPIHKFLDSHM